MKDFTAKTWTKSTHSPEHWLTLSWAKQSIHSGWPLYSRPRSYERHAQSTAKRGEYRAHGTAATTVQRTLWSLRSKCVGVSLPGLVHGSTFLLEFKGATAVLHARTPPDDFASTCAGQRTNYRGRRRTDGRIDGAASGGFGATETATVACSFTGGTSAHVPT